MKIVLPIIIAIAGLGLFLFLKSGPDLKAKQVASVKLRNTSLKTNLAELLRNKSCDQNPDKTKCLIDFVHANDGINYGTDLGLYNAAVFQVCQPKNLDCVLQTVNQIITLVDPKKIKNKIAQDLLTKKTKDVNEIFQGQLQFVNMYLLNHRKMIVSRFNSADKDQQAKFLTYVNTIDTTLRLISKEL